MIQVRNSPKRSAQILAVLLTLGVIAGIGFIRFPSDGEDTRDYRNLMLGHQYLVTQPFSSRFLHPAVVALVMHTFKVSDMSAATSVAILTLLIIVIGMALIFDKMKVSPFLILPAIFGFTFLDSFELIYMPDLFYTALLIILFLLLQYELFLPGALMVFILYCTRESTLVIGVVLITLAVLRARSSLATESTKQKGFGPAAAFLVATIIGFAFNRYITNKSQSNVHHLNGLVYMFGKMPFCFLKNVLGIEMWSNTLVGTEGNSPIYKYALPHWAQLGQVRSIGVAEYSVRYPLLWLIYLLSTFGVLWTIIARQITGRVITMQGSGDTVIKKAKSLGNALKSLIANEPFYSQVAMVLGLINWIIVPVLGSAVHRYTFYAWPIFWITAIRVFDRQYLKPARRNVAGYCLVLLLIHESLMWVMVMRRWFDPGALILFLLLPVCVVLHFIAWGCLGKLEVKDLAGS